MEVKEPQVAQTRNPSAYTYCSMLRIERYATARPFLCLFSMLAIRSQSNGYLVGFGLFYSKLDRVLTVVQLDTYYNIEWYADDTLRVWAAVKKFAS